MKRLTEIEKVVLNNKSDKLRKTLEFIIISGKVKRYFSLTDEQLNVRIKTRALALPRQIIFHLLYKHTKGESQSVIGNIYGRDHATVFHSTKVISGIASYDNGLAKFLSEIESSVLKYQNKKNKKVFTKDDIFNRLLTELKVENKNEWIEEFSLAN